MKHWYIHATSYECAKKILKEGFSCERVTTWVASFNNYIYLRRIPDAMDVESDDIIQILDDSVWNARITASLMNSQNTKLCYFLFYLDDELLDEDTSCEGMSDCFEIHINDINKELKNAKVVMEDGYWQEFRYLYLASVINNNQFNTIALNEKEELVIKSIAKSDVLDFAPYEVIADYDLNNLKGKVHRCVNLC